MVKKIMKEDERIEKRVKELILALKLSDLWN